MLDFKLHTHKVIVSHLVMHCTYVVSPVWQCDESIFSMATLQSYTTETSKTLKSTIAAQLKYNRTL